MCVHCFERASRVRGQDFEDALMGMTQEELNEMQADAVIELVRSAHAEQGGEDDDRPSDHLSARELEALPSHPATEHDHIDDCSVCLAAVRAGQEIARLPCAHTFHHPCIIRWLARSRRCPYCRADAAAGTAPSLASHDANERGTGGGTVAVP